MNKLVQAAMAIALLPMAQAAVADVTGDWKIEGTIGQMPVNITCKLNEKEHKLTGACTGTDIGELPLTGETTADSASWTYNVNYQGQQFTVTYNGKVSSPKEMAGDIALAGASQGSFTGKKQ